MPPNEKHRNGGNERAGHRAEQGERGEGLGNGQGDTRLSKGGYRGRVFQIIEDGVESGEQNTANRAAKLKHRGGDADIPGIHFKVHIGLDGYGLAAGSHTEDEHGEVDPDQRRRGCPGCGDQTAQADGGAAENENQAEPVGVFGKKSTEDHGEDTKQQVFRHGQGAADGGGQAQYRLPEQDQHRRTQIDQGGG